MKKLPFIISFCLVSVVIGCYFLIPSFQNFINEGFDVLTSNDQERIQRWVSKFRLAGPVVLILIMIVQMFLFVVPNVFVMMVAIISYGPVWGANISFSGVFASSSVGYMIGKYLGPVTVNKLLSKNAQQKTAEFVKDYGIPRNRYHTGFIVLKRFPEHCRRSSEDELQKVYPCHHWRNIAINYLTRNLWQEWQNTKSVDLDSSRISRYPHYLYPIR